VSYIENPNQYEGTDAQRIQQAVDAAAATCGRVVIPRENQGIQAQDKHTWILDEAIRLPSNIMVELGGCHIKLSNQCRDNFFRSGNSGIGIAPIEPAENIHLVGMGNAVLEGADRPRATGDSAKILGEHTFGTDTGVEGQSHKGDWRNIGVLLANVKNFSIQNIHFVDSHCWAISLEQCSQGILRDLSFNSTGSKTIDGNMATILNQDGIDLRQGCHDILIENISGQTGDDLIALTAIPQPGRQAGTLNSTMVSAERVEGDFPGIHNIIIRNVHGHCAGGHHIVRLLNTSGLPMDNILIDGLIDTSTPPYQSKAALKIGDTQVAYGGVNPLGTTCRILVNNVISRAKFAVLIGGSLCDSSISNVLQNSGDDVPVYFESGTENISNVMVSNVHHFSRRDKSN
jgi:hypothetical protein